MIYYKPLFPFIAGWVLLLIVPSLTQIALVNGISQIILFILVACIPAWNTGRLNYVDIAWPWGLVVIGIVTYLMSSGHHIRVLIVSSIYIFIGLRMGLGSLKMWKMGWFKTEFPRYQYQRRRWQRSGKSRIKLAIQVDIWVQGIANASFLAFPAFIIASNPEPTISYFEISGLIIWILAFVMEFIADAQKLQFLKRMKKQSLRNKVCNVGLWSLSRHPNYFAEWMVWNALVLASIPSWFQQLPSQHFAVWIMVAFGILFVSKIMYTTLVYYTGAVPSEYYSVQKRPEYKNYQKSTNRFFPWLKK